MGLFVLIFSVVVLAEELHSVVCCRVVGHVEMETQVLHHFLRTRAPIGARKKEHRDGLTVFNKHTAALGTAGKHPYGSQQARVTRTAEERKPRPTCI